MTVTASWDNENKTILRYEFDETWTWDDFFAARERANRLEDVVAHKLGVIMDASRIRGLPANMITNTRTALRSKHPNTIVIVVVVTNPFLHTLVTTLKNITPLGEPVMEIVSTMDEARRVVSARLGEATSGV